MVSGTIFDNGRTLSAPDARGVLRLGLALRRPERRPQLRRRRRSDARPVESSGADRPQAASVATPTPACPTASAASWATATRRRPTLGEFARNGWVNLVGGCCGTTPDWIAAIARAVEGVAPRTDPRPARAGRTTAAPSRWSIRPETNFVMVGERTNITGSLQVRPPDQGGQLRGGARRRPRAGRGRRQHPRRQHGRGPDRRRGGDDALPQPARRRAGHRQASRSWSTARSGRSSRPG